MIANIGIGAVVVGAYLRLVAPVADRTDALALASYLCFLAACLFSQSLRLSFETAVSALGLLAGFSLARRSPAMHPGGAGRWLLSSIALTLGLLFLALWGGMVVRWISLVGTTPPILEMRFQSLVFGHPHDVATLLVICAAGVFGLAGRTGRFVRLAVLIIVPLAVLIEGSRSVWLAALFASGGVGGVWLLRRGGLRWTGRRVVVAAGLAALAMAGAWLTGLADRLSDLGTVAARLEIWGSAIEAWRLSPITGLGPGSFPWDLQFTGHFDAPASAVRHPDNAVVQTLAVAGLVGLVGLGLAVAAVWRGRSRPADWPAAWTLAFFAGACMLTNPSDHGFLAVPVVLWAAAASRTRPVSRPTRARWFAWSSGVAGAAVLASAILWAGTALIHERALSATAAKVTDTLRLAITLDPSFALYHRELGAELLAAGNEEATVELERAVTLNRADAAAWRLLALARAATGDQAGAEAAAREAVRLGQSGTANLLTLAGILARTDADRLESRTLAGEALLATPWVTGDSRSRSLLAPGRMTEVLEAAITAWQEGTDQPTGDWIQPTWVVGMQSRDDLVVPAIDAAGDLRGSASALEAFFSCRPTAAIGLLGAVAGEDKSPWYWTVRYLVESGIGEPSAVTIWAGSVMSGTVERAAGDEPSLTTIDDRLTGLWGYGRQLLAPPDLAEQAPSAEEGLINWLRDPLGVARQSVPSSALATCSSVARQ